MLSPLESWAGLLNLFMQREGITPFSIYASTPIDQPYLRIDMKQNLQIYDQSDRSVFISIPQMHRLTKMVEEELDAYLDASNGHGNSAGLNVPFDLSRVERVILHPRIAEENDQRRNLCLEAALRAGLGCPVVNSTLYARRWE
ncbi:MAG: hypothetical protein A3I66_11865 [Burkholderiales bacterium RIFCSPLOWO2_02_FULL_57_36]|nr:MAG: hypothetical protein A3I66_11865 [Burkholderiales bacterium RIFCSPLOWO2_02_FULL_57_36]